MVRKVIPLIVVMAILLSACSTFAEKEPAMSLEDMQATAQAQAQTAIAQTQMALPTNTPEPAPPPATEEVVAEQLVEPQVVVQQPEVQPLVVVQATEESSSGGGSKCQRLTKDTKGKKVFIRVENQTTSDITFSATLQLTALGSCGSTSVTLEKNKSTVLEVPEGCYFLYTWINHPKKPTTNSNETCVKANNSDNIVQKWQVRREGIVVIKN